MLDRLLRLLKHRWMDDAGRVLSASATQRLQSAIAASERLHTGELRICVESGLPNSYLLRRVSMGSLLRERALVQFGRLGVWDTEANNGVLIYLCLAERAIELVADRGIHQLVPQQQWDTLVNHLGALLREGQFESGLLHSVDELSRLLVQHFAAVEGKVNPNELPNTVVVF